MLWQNCHKIYLEKNNNLMSASFIKKRLEQKKPNATEKEYFESLHKMNLMKAIMKPNL
jgi:hypothetical protein